MSEWQGWYQNEDSRRPAGWDQRTETLGAGAAGAGYGASPASSRSVWPEQPPASSPYSEPDRWGLDGGGGYGRPRRRGRRIALIALGVVIALVAGTVGSYFWIDSKLNKSVTLPATTLTSAGTNWLITGSDSRQGLSRTQRDALHVGSDSGTLNSDSVMLLHMGSGKPVLLSIPRDSYVPIPGHGHNKLNASLAFGGPQLLIQTVENVTGLRIDHYMGIGFGGLVQVVNKVGGVTICLKTPLAGDQASGLPNLSRGCHNLNGAQSLAFVRDRHSFTTQDLQRIQDQRAFLSALLKKATSPGVYLNPFTMLPFGSTAASSMSVDKGTGMKDLVQAAFALRGPQSGTVPIANPNYQTSVGDTVLWNRTKALQLFNALKNDQPVPAGILSGTTVG
jgi:LCP family protein required for cell wall assembly